MATNRYFWIDFVKALAITLVVLYHSGFCSNKFVFPLLAMCVPLFFVVNGMLVLNKERSILYFIQKVCKIVFLMLVWSTIQTCVNMFYNNDPYVLKDIYHNVISQRMWYCHTFWFMSTLTVLYIVYPIISAFINNNKLNIYYMLCISFLLSFNAFGYVIPIDPIPNLMRCWHGEALFYAIAGFYIIQHTETKFFTSIKSWQILLIIVLLWSGPLLAYSGIEFFSKYKLNPVFDLYQSPFVMMMTVVVVFYIKKINPKENLIVSLLGKNTLGIYCIHPSIMRALNYYIAFDNPIL